MTGKDQWVAVITRGSQGIGAGLVTGCRRLGAHGRRQPHRVPLADPRVIAEMLKRNGGPVVNISAILADHANSRAPSVLAALTKAA